MMRKKSRNNQQIFNTSELNKSKGLLRNALKTIIMCFILILLNTGCTKNYRILMTPPQNDSNEDAFWETIDVEDTELSRSAIIKHMKLCRNTGADSQLIIYKGKIVSEWYSERYQEPVGAMSSTKVVASLLIGILNDSGKLNYQDKVKDILPGWTGGYRDDVRIVDILTHSAGFEQRTNEKSIGYYEGNKSEFAYNLVPDYNPAVKYSYSNEGVQLLEPIIRAVSQKDTEEFAKKNLFAKIGMNNTAFHSYGGSPWLYSELRTTTRDLARLGILMSHSGRWENQQIVSSDYIERATTPSPLQNEMGFLWWILDRNKTVKGFYASGYLNTDIYVFNDYDVVIVRTQAPKMGYSGKAESGNYFKKAMPIFKKIVGEKR